MHPRKFEEQREASLCGRKLRTPEAARYLGVSQSTLAQWRTYGCGPAYSKLGGIIIYDIADLNGFAAQRRRLSTADAAPGGA